MTKSTVIKTQSGSESSKMHDFLLTRQPYYFYHISFTPSPDSHAKNPAG